MLDKELNKKKTIRMLKLPMAHFLLKNKLNYFAKK